MTTTCVPGTVSSSETMRQARRLLAAGLVSRVVYAVCKLGIPDALGVAPRTAEELAGSCGGDTDVLVRYLRVLAAEGYVREDAAAAFHLTKSGELLRRDVPGSLWPLVVLTTELLEPNANAAVFAARTGRSAFVHAHGCSLYEYLAAHPDAERLFAEGMTARAARLHAEVLDAVDWAGVHHVVDVGGNRGGLLVSILRRLPSATGVLFDQPQVVADAGIELAESGVAERIDVEGGDFFVAVPPGGDVYLIANVLWNWDDDRATKILRRCRDAMGAAARLLVVEPVLPATPAPHPALVTDLVNLWAFGGRTRGLGAWEALLHAAGFTMQSCTETSAEWSVIEAHRS